MQSNVGTYGRRIHIYPTVKYLDYVKFHQQHAREKKINNPMWLHMAGEVVSIFFYRYVYLADVSFRYC